MKIHEATEQAYKNGYAKGYEDGRPKWIPVTERLPEEEGWYLVYTTPNREHKSINKAMFCKGYAWSNGEPYWRGAGGHWANVTHWMPLPEPPKECFTTQVCENCGCEFVQYSRRKRKYCGDRCMEQAYQRSRRAREKNTLPMADIIYT